MSDHESRDLATAARLAHEAMVDPGDDRPSPAEIDDELAYERRSKLIDGAWTPGRGRDEEAGW